MLFRSQKPWASPVLASQRKTVGRLVAQIVALSPTCVGRLKSPACNWQAKAAMLVLDVAMVLGQLIISFHNLTLASGLLPVKARIVREVYPSC